MKILVVDDDQGNLCLLEIMLKRSGYQVASAVNGAEALGKLRAAGFDLIIADILMPVMDGFQLCREVKGDDELKDIPFVFYTATYTDEKDEELALKVGADKFIVKPLEPHRFISIIQDVITDVEEGKIGRKKPVLEEEKEVLKLYNERLVKKLEKKMLDLKREISERKRAEEELTKYRDHLERLVEERTADLETFTFSVSHDLRAPLRAMQGLSQALLEDYADRLDPAGQDYARHIATAAQYMDTLIQDLLAYSRLSRADLQLQAVDLEDVVHKALSLLEAEIQEKDAQVTTERPLLQVVGHQSTLVQVVENLLSNALKFVAPGVQPQVRVWTETPLHPPRREGRGGYVRLWVEDNGIGIAPEHHERIFHILERLHGIETYPGTGVGLAIVRKAVQRMGGQVGVESEPGLGSRFWIELVKA